jgi:heptosyltransferase III
MTQKYPDLQSVKKILVAKLRHHGDVLLTSPLFSILKQRFPNATIDAYIYKETAPMLEGHPAIDELLFYDKAIKNQGFLKKIFYEGKLLSKIRKKKYDLVINLTEGDRGALAAWVSKATVRVGFDPEGSGMFKKKDCYTHITRICHQTRHTVERHLDVLRCLGIFPLLEERDLFLNVPREAYKKVEALLAEAGVESKRFVMIHPVSRWLFKCLPEQTIAEVIEYLHSRGEKIVLTASSDPLEMAMNEKIISLAKGVPIYHLGGKITLKELGALIDLSKLLICVDSVPMHMASALKAPVVALFGPTSEKTWAPWRNPNARVIAQEYSCRPCYMPGCGGSGKSDCLETLSSRRICQEVEVVLSSHQMLDKLYNLKPSII